MWPSRCGRRARCYVLVAPPTLHRDVASLCCRRNTGGAMAIQRSRSTCGRLLGTLMLCVLSAAGAHAQSTFATLTGTITDQSGGALPGATVTVTNVATGLVRTTSTSSSGEYQLTNLDASSYRMVVQLDGFADATREVALLARQIVRADLQLTVAG